MQRVNTVGITSSNCMYLLTMAHVLLTTVVAINKDIVKIPTTVIMVLIVCCLIIVKGFTIISGDISIQLVETNTTYLY